MQPLSAAAPPAMLPVADRSLAARVADAAVEAGAEELVFAVTDDQEAVADHFGSQHGGIPVAYATGRTASDALAAATKRVSGPFAVLEGTARYDQESLATLFDAAPAVGYVETPGRASDVVPGGQFGPLQAVADAPDHGLLLASALPGPAGDHVATLVQDDGRPGLGEVLRQVLDRRPVTCAPVSASSVVVEPWDLLGATERALADLAERVRGEVHADADLRGPVVVEAGATVDAGVVVEGPVVVRSGATVGPNAYLRGATVVGEGASVGHAVEVKNSLLMAGASVNHLSYVGDSVVGPDANLGAGTVTANLRHDDDEVLAGEDDRPTGRRKFGAVVGPGAKTGINTSLLPGVVLSAGTWTAASDAVTDAR
jgi:bifunctional UDP-N-acetylglucosamine pyrophosphorylase/glucosamine-1-phosphate N-acetyltransferase